MKRKLKVGMVVAIHFLDHMHNSDGDKPQEAIMYGRVAVITDIALTVDAWALEDPQADRGKSGDVTESFTIVRATISKIKQLEER